MSTNALFRPLRVRALLGVSSATLRRWSDRFADHLSPAAGHFGGVGQRRYSEGDVRTLQRVQAWLAGGCTYAEVNRYLRIDIRFGALRTAVDA